MDLTNERTKMKSLLLVESCVHHSEHLHSGTSSWKGFLKKKSNKSCSSSPSRGWSQMGYLYLTWEKEKMTFEMAQKIITSNFQRTSRISVSAIRLKSVSTPDKHLWIEPKKCDYHKKPKLLLEKAFTYAEFWLIQALSM